MTGKIYDISVVVPTYNNARYIAQALESVLAQEGPIKEVIIIDDGSTDESAKILEGYKGKADITIIYNQKNMGPSYSRNIGINKARGRYVTFLDADDYWLHGNLVGLYSNVKSNLDSQVVFGEHTLLNEYGELLPQEPFFPEEGVIADLDQQIFKRNCVSMSSVLIDTKLAQEVLFDESLRSAEDYDFWIRVAASGAQFYHIHQAAAVYRKHSTSLSTNRQLALVSTERVLQKNYHLAKTPRAKKYIAGHRGALLFDRIKLSPDRAAVAKIFKDLKENRALLLRETIVRYAALVFGKYAALVACKVLF